MNNCFGVLIVYLTLRYAVTCNEHYISIGAFVCGLALCNQVFRDWFVENDLHFVAYYRIVRSSIDHLDCFHPTQALAEEQMVDCEMGVLVFHWSSTLCVSSISVKIQSSRRFMG